MAKNALALLKLTVVAQQSRWGPYLNPMTKEIPRPLTPNEVSRNTVYHELGFVLSQIVETQEAEVAALRARIDALEKCEHHTHYGYQDEHNYFDEDEIRGLVTKWLAELDDLTKQEKRVS